MNPYASLYLSAGITRYGDIHGPIGGWEHLPQNRGAAMADGRTPVQEDRQ